MVQLLRGISVRQVRSKRYLIFKPNIADENSRRAWVEMTRAMRQQKVNAAARQSAAAVR
jgi:hypothetical protein